MALLQVISPSTAAWADARLLGDALRSSSGHVEEHPTAACPRMHPSECVLCQYLTTGGVWRRAFHQSLEHNWTRRPPQPAPPTCLIRNPNRGSRAPRLQPNDSGGSPALLDEAFAVRTVK